MGLSKRMEAVVSMVSPQSFAIADVGCDHAYVSIALIERKLTPKVIAMDVRKGPLRIAERNVRDAGLHNMIDLRLSDGLSGLSVDEVGTVIIAGMGGLLITGILERGREILTKAEVAPTLILQPQSELSQVRSYLLAHGYDIVCEKMLMEDGKYYTVLKAELACGESNPMQQEAELICGESNPLQREEEIPSGGDNPVCRDEELACGGSNPVQREAELAYGAYNLARRDAVLLSYLERERKLLSGIYEELRENSGIGEGESVSEKTRLRMEELRAALERNRYALNLYEEV